MAARKRAQERDYNRRRWIILDKGIDMAYNQKDTALGECLLKWNVREESLLQRRHRLLQRQGDISVGQREQEKKRFVVTRDQALREPTLLLERTPTAEQYPDYVDLRQPRYMRPLNTRQSKTPEFSTFSVFQAVKKRKRNIWEDAVKQQVQFRPTLCPCARLNRQDSEKLLMDWVVVNEKQTKALGLKNDNRSAPIKQVRTGLNPLNLPPRLNSRLHHMAHDLLDDIPTPSSSGSSDGGDDAVSVVSSVVDAAEFDDSEQQEPVFVTQLSQYRMASDTPQQQPKQHQEQQKQQPQHTELILFETKDNSKKEKQLAHKRQVDGALVSIYELLDRRRVTGRPRLRNAEARSKLTYANRPSNSATTGATTTTTASTSAAPSRVSTAASSFVIRVPVGQMDNTQPDQQPPTRTTCRTAESIRILADSRKGPRPSNSTNTKLAAEL